MTHSRGKDAAWREAHIIGGHEIDQHASQVGIHIDLPGSLQEDTPSIVAYGPVSQKVVDFDESLIGSRYNRLKGGYSSVPEGDYKSPYGEFVKAEMEAKQKASAEARVAQQESERASLGMDEVQYAEFDRQRSTAHLEAMGKMTF